jgi:hypothetical protein
VRQEAVQEAHHDQQSLLGAGAGLYLKRHHRELAEVELQKAAFGIDV